MRVEVDIEFGREYQDSMTGFTGKATAVSVFSNGCQRVLLERLDDKGDIKEVWFDEARLINTLAAQERPGGPRNSDATRASDARR